MGSSTHFCVHTEFLLSISWDTWMCKCPKGQDKCKLLLFAWWFQSQQMEVLGRNSSLGEGRSGSRAAQEILLAPAGKVSFTQCREIAEVHQICCCSFSWLSGRLLCFAVTYISLWTSLRRSLGVLVLSLIIPWLVMSLPVVMSPYLCPHHRGDGHSGNL